MSEHNEVRKIQFEGGELTGVRVADGKVYLAVKKACLDIGLNEDHARRQIKNIQGDVVLSKGGSNLTLLTEGGKQQVFCLHEDFITLWLAKISLTPRMKQDRPEAVERLVSYQLKAAKILHDAFMSTEEQTAELFDDLGIKGRIATIESRLNDIEAEARSIVDVLTLNYSQQQKIQSSARDHVRKLLGSMSGVKYKHHARIYFKNLWLDFCEHFSIGSYKDLHPKRMADAVTFIGDWRHNG